MEGGADACRGVTHFFDEPANMRLSLLLAFLALLALLCLAPTWASAYDDSGGDESVLLSQVRTLVFKRGKLTAGRRSSPIPQLSCVGGPCDAANIPDAVMCEQIGTDYATNDPQWKCTATLLNGLELGKTDVSCEGYRHADDRYILRGSCGLKFTLQGAPVRKTTTKTQTVHQRVSHDWDPISDVLSGVLTLCVVLVVCWSIVWCLETCSRWSSYVATRVHYVESTVHRAPVAQATPVYVEDPAPRASVYVVPPEAPVPVYVRTTPTVRRVPRAATVVHETTVHAPTSHVYVAPVPVVTAAPAATHIVETTTTTTTTTEEQDGGTHTSTGFGTTTRR